MQLLQQAGHTLRVPAPTQAKDQSLHLTRDRKTQSNGWQDQPRGVQPLPITNANQWAKPAHQPIPTSSDTQTTLLFQAG
jgi:hypothetical protein